MRSGASVKRGREKKKKRDGNVIRTRRLIASPSSPALSPVLNRAHLDLFSPFPLIFTPSALISCVCVRVLPSRQDSGVIKQTASQITAPSSDFAGFHLLHYSGGHRTVNPATASLLFTTFCPPELSSVRINTRHNTVQE